MEILSKCIVGSSGVVSRLIDSETFLMTEDGKKVHMINKVGTLIWECADGRIPIKGIIAKILKKFDTDEETAEADCLEFINKLFDMKLLRITEKS
ncbi:MAG: PqqD family protein [Desulfobacterales bacterium]|nr:PqqD family protein [Desulfobacterales bacterium]